MVNSELNYYGGSLYGTSEIESLETGAKKYYENAERIKYFLGKDITDKNWVHVIIGIITFFHGSYMWSNFVKPPNPKPADSPSQASSTNPWVIGQWIILVLLVIMFFYFFSWNTKLIKSIKGQKIFFPWTKNVVFD
jgi:hypothetical protein